MGNSVREGQLITPLSQSLPLAPRSSRAWRRQDPGTARVLISGAKGFLLPPNAHLVLPTSDGFGGKRLHLDLLPMMLEQDQTSCVVV